MAAAGIDPVIHFVCHGIYENRYVNCHTSWQVASAEHCLSTTSLADDAAKDFDPLAWKDKIVATLTSYGERVNTVSQAVESILRQTAPPDLILLWLAEEEFPQRERQLPQVLLKLTENSAFKIMWTKDIRSYKKIIPALRLLPQSVLITFDDDIIYNDDTVAKLIAEHKKYPATIIAHRAHRITFDSLFKRNPYSKWIQRHEQYSCSFLNFQTGCGSVLYPPGCLFKDALDESIFLRLAPEADDIWLWSMAVLAGTRIIITKNCNKHLTYIEGTQEQKGNFVPLHHKNVNEGKNDKYLDAVTAAYPGLWNRALVAEVVELNIVAIADANYVKIVCVMLASLLESRFKNTNYRLNLLLIDTDNREPVNLLESAYGVKVNVVQMTGLDFSKVHKTGHQLCTASPSALAKFLLPDIFPACKRALYLDADILVRRDLKFLFDTDLNGKTLGAVLDSGQLYSERQQLYSSKYFNSGVILYDMERFREKNLSATLFKEKEKLKDNSLVDQHVFNMVCRDDWQELPLEYNLLYTNLLRAKKLYSMKDLNNLFKTHYQSIEDIANKAAIVHFASKDKPWKSVKFPYHTEWFAIHDRLFTKKAKKSA